MKIGEYRKEDKISLLYSVSNCENDLDLDLLLYSFAKKSFESKVRFGFFSLVY